MAPQSVQTLTSPSPDPVSQKAAAPNGDTHIAEPEQPAFKAPLKLSGILDQFESFDLTPTIGREFENVSLAEWLRAPNSDELIRDLAITISQRGVVFFRAQDSLDDSLQKELVQRLGELSGKPSSSGLHIHPVSNSGRELGGSDDEISIISSVQAKKLYRDTFLIPTQKRQNGKDNWHSDITFEPVPADYSLLRLTELPKTGGDTLWASGYELYDRLSTPYQTFLETLTATYSQPKFNATALANNFPLHPGPRGSPLNTGTDLTATHPVIRTNPVTGWKSVFAVGHHVQHINDLTPQESRALLNWFVDLVATNHDLQVRFRWKGRNDVAVWDNRSTFHAATQDLVEGGGERLGHRAVGIGERPFLERGSLGRREALRGEALEKRRGEEEGGREGVNGNENGNGVGGRGEGEGEGEGAKGGVDS